jgi:hypothetical protein
VFWIDQPSICLLIALAIGWDPLGGSHGIGKEKVVESNAEAIISSLVKCMMT